MPIKAIKLVATLASLPIARPLRLSCFLGIALLMPISAQAMGGDDAESFVADDFYITMTANGLCLCGEGFGGIYGCIDEAVSRDATSVVISASSEANVQALQELINAVHSVGFDLVGVATFDESDT